MLQGHGDDWYKYDFPILHNFSSNVWHGGTDERLIERLQHSLGSIGRYPHPDAGDAAALAAAFHGLPAENCLFTNGATEAFYLIVQHFSGQEALIFTPTFSEYEDACRLYGLNLQFRDRAALLNSEINAALVFICNPNNPDGSLHTREALKPLLARYPLTCFVLDEAYMDFAQQDESCIPLLGEYPNLIIVKSLTKLFCIPGLRAGYILCPADIRQQLQACKMPWSVNSLAIAAARYIFEHYQQLKPAIGKALEESRRFQGQLRDIEALEVIPSGTTYFLLRLRQGTAAELKEYLAHEHRILVRDATNFRGIEGEYIRVASQAKETNERLAEALLQWSRTS
jgi:threonine-phosphate decarboxylase